MPSSRSAASSDASRPRAGGALTPSSSSTLNKHRPEALSDMDGKQSRDLDALEHLLKASIVVKPHPPNVLSKPCTLQPLMLVAREDLALSLLDLASPNGDLAPSRLYESHVKILDLEYRMAERPSVLIARNESSKTSYVLERSESNIYTCCKLGAWASLSSLAEKATVSTQQFAQAALNSKEARQAPVTTPHLHKGHKEKRLAIEALQSIVRKRSGSHSVSKADEGNRAEKRQRSEDDRSHQPAVSDESPTQEDVAPVSTVAPAAPPETQFAGPTTTTAHDSALDLPAQPTAEDIFNNIRAQYTEALYRSKGSLAYFAKGPLSRARAAFHLDCDGTMHMNDLVEFLKSLVMTTVQVDKKYRETIVDIISKMKTLVESSEDGTKSKKKRTKKLKLGKDALYPYENSQIRKWWIANKLEISEEESGVSMAQIRSHVDLLRTRETQLQMILILEILALEPLRAQQEEAESQLPGMPGASETQGSTGPQPPKKRNKHNFPVLVDVHADRLCIWQSTASDEMRLLEDSQVATHVVGGQSAQKASADPLKDFCTDIIMPFFAARLPELCDSINRKLGGPLIISPPKPRHSKPSSNKQQEKPGAATKRPAPPKKSKTIERALYKEQSRRSVSRGPSSTIALMRSATSAAIPGLKREGSETPLGDIPKPEQASGPSKPGLLARSNSLTALDDNKAQKKAMVDAELQDAISAVRKPNRELAGKSIVAEQAERKTSGGLSHIRKSKKPTRHPLFQSVQVKATPANNRFRDALAEEAQSSTSKPSGSGLPPSSASVVPGTAPRRSVRDFRDLMPSSAIEETPVKPSASATRTSAPDLDSVPPSSPLMVRKPSKQNPAMVPDSAVRPRGVRGASPSPGDAARILDTPVKQMRSFDAMFEDEIAATPMALAATPVAKKPQSIYERLGWDDDFDDL